MGVERITEEVTCELRLQKDNEREEFQAKRIGFFGLHVCVSSQTRIVVGSFVYQQYMYCANVCLYVYTCVYMCVPLVLW